MARLRYRTQKKIEKMEERKKTWLKIICIILLLGFISFRTEDYFGWIGYRETWTTCIDYMKEGTLWSGQPHCEGALVPFYVLYGLDDIFGREYVQKATILFSTSIALLFFWIFWKVVKKEELAKDFFLPALLFGLLFYINTVANIEAVLNSFFFFSAYYLLFYTQHKWKYYGAGILLLLALLSKINVVIQIAFLLFWYGYENRLWYLENKKVKIQLKKEIIWGYGQILVPIGVGFLVASKVYEYFWIYSWHVFTKQNIALSLIQTAKEMILFDIAKTDIIYIVVLATAILCTYLFWKEKKFYALISGPVFLLAIFLIIRAFGIQFATGVRYWSVIFPFTVLCILKLKEMWTEAPQKQIMYGFLLMIVLFPGLYEGPFLLKDDLSYVDTLNVIDRATEGWKEKDALIKEIHYGYSTVPEQEGRILLEDDPAGFERKIISFGSNIPYEKVDFLTKKYMESHPDIWGFPRYQELLGENLIYAPTSGDLNEKEQEVIAQIENGTYGLIIFGPPEWAISERILSQVNNETLNEYCQVLVPNNVWLTEGGWHFSYFFFKDSGHCNEMREKMVEYFSAHFQEMCTKDKTTANAIGQVMRDNGISFNRICTDGGSALEALKTGRAIKKIEILAMLTLFALPLFYGVYKEENGRRKKLYIMLCVMIIIFVLVLLVMDVEIPFKTGIVQIVQ